eukprot:6612063-Alexandrium_andersonii.AAC.1
MAPFAPPALSSSSFAGSTNSQSVSEEAQAQHGTPPAHKPGRAGRGRAERDDRVPLDREHAELDGLQLERR